MMMLVADLLIHMMLVSLMPMMLMMMRLKSMANYDDDDQLQNP